MLNPQALTQAHHNALVTKYGERNVFVTMLYGSQNYNMATADSDVDTKAMMLPSFGDFALREKWLSVEETLPAGLSTVKDVRGMCENFLKSNLNFLECLYTQYYVVNPVYADAFLYLKNHAELVGNNNPYRLMHAVAGMAAQKYHALEKPFESKAAVLAKYGYDPKQLHHLCRLRFFMLDYLRNPVLGDCLVPTNPATFDWLLSLKTNPLPLEEARREANFAMDSVNTLLKNNIPKVFEKDPPTSTYCKQFLNEFCLALLRQHLTHELQSGAQLPLF